VRINVLVSVLNHERFIELTLNGVEELEYCQRDSGCLSPVTLWRTLLTGQAHA
jgi:hypothetical protein